VSQVRPWQQEKLHLPLVLPDLLLTSKVFQKFQGHLLQQGLP
jgi:hypothetical protein